MIWHIRSTNHNQMNYFDPDLWFDVLLGWFGASFESKFQSQKNNRFLLMSSPSNYHPNYYLSDWATHTIVLVIMLASNSHLIPMIISLPWCYHDFTQVIPWFYHDLPKLYIVIPVLPWFSHLFTTWFWLLGKQPGHLVLRRRARQRPTGITKSAGETSQNRTGYNRLIYNYISG